jgi:hypothetical protein
MRRRIVLLSIGFGLLGGGCSIIENATRAVTSDVSQCCNDFLEKRRNARWAEEAWEKVTHEAGPFPHNDDYAAGFKAGFADFLYQGGDGEPPPLPPRKYRALHYQTPQGYQAIEDWFAGFRHGAAVARDGGYRRWVIGPSPLHIPPPPPPAVDVSKAASVPTAPAATDVSKPACRGWTTPGSGDEDAGRPQRSEAKGEGLFHILFHKVALREGEAPAEPPTAGKSARQEHRPPTSRTDSDTRGSVTRSVCEP